MAKRCPCDSSSKKAPAKSVESAKPPEVEIDPLAAFKAFGAEGTSAFEGPGAPSAEIDSPESLSAPDVSVRLVPDGEFCVGEFIGPDGNRYRQMRKKRGGGYLDWSEPAD